MINCSLYHRFNVHQIELPSLCLFTSLLPVELGLSPLPLWFQIHVRIPQRNGSRRLKYLDRRQRVADMLNFKVLNHKPSKLNTNDCFTTSLVPKQLKKNCQWGHGGGLAILKLSALALPTTLSILFYSFSFPPRTCLLYVQKTKFTVHLSVSRRLHWLWITRHLSTVLKNLSVGAYLSFTETT